MGSSVMPTGCSPEVLFEVGFAALLIPRSHAVRLAPGTLGLLHHPPEEIGAAVDLLLAIGRRRSGRTRGAEHSDDSFNWGFNPLRRFPLVRCANGELLVLNPQFLLERICGTAYFWEVITELRRRIPAGAAKTAASRAIGKFGDYTGHVAEEYAADRFIRITPNRVGGPRQLWREDGLRKLWPKGKCCDFLIDAGSSWIALEAVDHAIKAAASEAGSLDAFERDLELIVDVKARQLAGTILRLINAGGSLPGMPARLIPPSVSPGHRCRRRLPVEPHRGPRRPQSAPQPRAAATPAHPSSDGGQRR